MSKEENPAMFIQLGSVTTGGMSTEHTDNGDETDNGDDAALTSGPSLGDIVVLKGGGDDRKVLKDGSARQEQSLNPNDMGTQQTMRRLEQFFDDDNPPTSKRELWSWYINDWANSVFANSGMFLSIPLLLTSLAEQSACNSLDYGCDIYGSAIHSNTEVKVNMGGWRLKPESYAASMVSLSGLFQAFVYCYFGPLADFGQYRKQLFTITTILGAVTTCMYVFMAPPDTWLLAGWWLILTTVLFGLSQVFYNAYLPLLVEHHPKIQKMIINNIDPTKIDKRMERLNSAISQRGFGMGYLGTTFAMVITILILFFSPASNFKDREDYKGSTSGASSFDERWGDVVTDIHLWWYEDSTKSQIYGMEFAYDNGLDGKLQGSNTSTSQTLQYAMYSPPTSTHIVSVQLWLRDDTSSVAAIQFFTEDSISDSSIYGSTTASQVVSKDKTYTIKTSSTDYALGGYSGYTKGDADITTEDVSMITALNPIFIDQTYAKQLNTVGYRMNMLFVGLWWLIFAIPPLLFLKARPGPPFPDDRRVYTYSFEELYDTFAAAKSFPNMFRFLLAFFMFSDGINTLATCSVLFAVVELELNSSFIAALVLEAQLMAALGNYFFLWLEEKFSLDIKKMIMGHLWVMTIIPLYALIGALPNAPFGLISGWEMVLYGVVYGMNVGSLQSYARTVYTQLIPVGRETEMFALFEITNKGSSWLGPLVVTFVSNAASMRLALFYVFVFFALPLPIIWWGVDVAQGKREAGRDIGTFVTRCDTQNADHPMFLQMVEDINLGKLDSPKGSSLKESSFAGSILHGIDTVKRKMSSHDQPNIGDHTPNSPSPPIAEEPDNDNTTDAGLSIPTLGSKKSGHTIVPSASMTVTALQPQQKKGSHVIVPSASMTVSKQPIGTMGGGSAAAMLAMGSLPEETASNRSQPSMDEANDSNRTQPSLDKPTVSLPQPSLDQPMDSMISIDSQPSMGGPNDSNVSASSATMIENNSSNPHSNSAGVIVTIPGGDSSTVPPAEEPIPEDTEQSPAQLGSDPVAEHGLDADGLTFLRQATYDNKQEPTPEPQQGAGTGAVDGGGQDDDDDVIEKQTTALTEDDLGDALSERDDSPFFE